MPASPAPGAMPRLMGHGPQCHLRCQHVRRSCRASLAPHRPRGGPWSAVGPSSLMPSVTALRNARLCLIQNLLAVGVARRVLLEDGVRGCFAFRGCSAVRRCSQGMLSGDALLLEDALGGCSWGDALFSEEWEERAAEGALAHTGRAPWLTEVLHSASAHKHPRKVPWMEKGNLRAPCRGSDDKEYPKEHFSTGNGIQPG